jgi:hypothetical protein
MFIGYNDDDPGYWILNLATGKLVRTIHVTFVESQPAHAPIAPPIAFGTSQASPPNGIKHKGAINASLSCADSTQFIVPTISPFTVIEDALEDTNPTADKDHTNRGSFSCFATAANVQCIKMTAGVFTQNKPPRPARTKLHFARSEWQLAPDEEPKTYPPAAHIPVPIDIKHALSGKYVVGWRKAIRSDFASLHRKGTFRMEYLPLGRNAIGNNWVLKMKAKPDGSRNRFKPRLVAHGFNQWT